MTKQHHRSAGRRGAGEAARASERARVVKILIPISIKILIPISMATAGAAVGACVPSRQPIGWGQQAQGLPTGWGQLPPTASATASPAPTYLPSTQPTGSAAPTATQGAPPGPAPSSTTGTRPRFRVPRPAPQASTTASAPRAPAPSPAPGAACGEVTLDGAVMPLDCVRPDYARLPPALASAAAAAAQGAGQGGASVASVGGGAKPTPLPEYVDHRRDGLVGPVRAQGRVGAGVAMALAGAIDQALIRNGGGFVPVSAQHLWARSPQPSLAGALGANLGKAVAAETTLPYVEARACEWASPEAARVCRPQRREAPGGPDLAKAEAAPSARMTGFAEVDATNGDALREAIARGLDVLVALRVDAAAFQSVAKSPDPEPLVADYTGTTSAHALLVVGYARQDGQWFFLLKNGWGPAWGAAGYAWVAESTLKKNALGAFVVQASVASGPTMGTQPSICPPDQLADTVTKQCAPACADRTPRTNGACATAGGNGGASSGGGGCPAGFIVVAGRCAVAAPTKTGGDPKTGVSYACGAAGCSYLWKKGTLGCLQDSCALTCPAPKSNIAVDPAGKGATCRE